MRIMLCLKFCRSAPPSTISSRLLFPITALSRLAAPGTSGFKSVEPPWKICRPVTANPQLSCVPQRRPPPASNQLQGQSAHDTARKAVHHRASFARSALLPRLSPLITLRSFYKSASIQSSIRPFLHQNPDLRFHATAKDPVATFVQPLDSSCRCQSVRRGFAISLPILIIYILFYLLNFVPWDSKLGRQYKNTVVRFWCYQRHEGFLNVAVLGSYVTSQFTHNGLTSLVIDSLVLIGVASILGSVFNRRTFYVVYVLGGFLAAAADCPWARVTNPCRSITQAQLDHVLTSVRLVNQAHVKLRASPFNFTMRGFIDLLNNPRDLSKDIEEVKNQKKVLDMHYPIIRDFDRWCRPNLASRGSLVPYVCQQPLGPSDPNVSQTTKLCSRY